MRGQKASSRVIVLMACLAVMLGLAIAGGMGAAAGATRTLSPGEESALPTLGPDEMVPDEVIVQFSREMSDSEIAGFASRFRLELLATIAFPPAEPFYLFRILDGATPPAKRLEILAGDPLVALVTPNALGYALDGYGPGIVSPSAQPTPMTPFPDAPRPTATLTASAPTAAGSRSPTPEGADPVQLVIVGAALAAAAAALIGGLLVVARRRS